MFDIGFSEMLLLGAIALIAVGPKQLPEVARTIGRMLNEFKRATGDFSRTLSETRDSAIKSATEARESYNQGFKQPSNSTSSASAAKPEVQPSQSGSIYPHADITPQAHFGDTLGPDEQIFSPIDPLPSDHSEEEQLAFSMSESSQEPELPKRKEES